MRCDLPKKPILVDRPTIDLLGCPTPLLLVPSPALPKMTCSIEDNGQTVIPSPLSPRFDWFSHCLFGRRRQPYALVGLHTVPSHIKQADLNEQLLLTLLLETLLAAREKVPSVNR